MDQNDSNLSKPKHDQSPAPLVIKLIYACMIIIGIVMVFVTIGILILVYQVKDL